MDPQPFVFPDVLQSLRLNIRLVQVEDAAAINAAIVESFAELHEWMPWAATLPSVADTQQFAREAQANYSSGKDVGLQVQLRHDNTLIAMTGFHDLDARIPKLEIGYWLRTGCVGHGYVTEIVKCLTDFAFATWRVNRIQIRMDNLNKRSWRVAERAGYRLEGIIRNDTLTPDGSLRDTRVYAKIRRLDGVVE